MAGRNVRLASSSNVHVNDIPIPTTRRPPQHANTLRRNKTLTRPERGVATVPLITPPTLLPGPGSSAVVISGGNPWSAWNVFCHAVTFWAPPFLLSSLGGLKDKATRQAWREKIGLCTIALGLGGIIGFLTVGLDRALCPQNTDTNPDRFIQIGTTPGLLGISGWSFNVSDAKSPQEVDFQQISRNLSGFDISGYFNRDITTNYPRCRGLKFQAAIDGPCPGSSSCIIQESLTPSTLQKFNLINNSHVVGYDWGQINKLDNYFVIDGAVLNFVAYMKAHPSPLSNDTVDHAIRTILQQRSGGRDGTRFFYTKADLRSAVPCIMERYYAGNIDKITPGCVVSQLILYAGLIVILGLVLARFAMACIFNWFLSARLTATPKNLSRTVISPAVMPEGANVQINSKHGTAPWAGEKQRSKQQKTNSISPVISMSQIGAELFTICLVTCYSEGEEGIKGTLDSISLTSYSDSRKLIFVVCDGMITGAGEKLSTPDICVNLLDVDPRFGEPAPMAYAAVGLGDKKTNRAMVYAGHYTVAGRRTPTVIVVKCGTEREIGDKKAGNRGKRDSQLILMNLFSRVTYNDRMSPLDYDLFRKMHSLMGVTPDFFEACLMVDADTRVHHDSITQLVNSLHHDPFIMGVCGETRISNKRQSWVTAIQVYEYFISHHLAKAFEAVFGGVTCLPGCFSMYRLKGRKVTDDDWVPLLVNPEIVQEYSQSEVATLHQKNLLLLGEDRFLTTILLRKFPNRKMMFIPQARCRTVAPDSFSVLLSQRRRWINSTIHNLMELVRVRNLCGTFCFSMQFVVFMDLLGTAALPVAISLTYALIVNMVLSPPNSFEKAIPLILLVSVIGLPAILILITTRKVVYIFWMLIYLIALPVWNFVLPLYAFWHFDDFSWGETRKVEGEAKGAAHDMGKRGASRATVPLRRWEEWERSRLRKLKRDEKRIREMEQAFPTGYPSHNRDFTPQHDFDVRSGSSDTLSLASSEEDLWGAQIGGYNENSSAFPPPPPAVGLVAGNPDLMASTTTLGDDDMEALLDSGFDDSPSQRSSTRYSRINRSSVHPSTPRYQLTDSLVAPPRDFQAYPNPSPGPISARRSPPVPRERVISPTSPFVPVDGSSSAVQWQSHAKKRSFGKGSNGSSGEYGPLGPLDPGTAS